MREIKCRAKTEFSTTELDKLGIKHENGWIYGTYLDGYIVNEVVEATNEYISLGNWFPVLENTVGQYTGLKDKNGKEIYDGDIVTTDINRPYLIVEFRNGCFMFNCNDGHNDYYDIMLPILEEPQTTYKYGEVVGNVYENKDLLR